MKTMDYMARNLDASRFPPYLQRLFTVFCFFLAWPALAIGSSVTFYIFVLIAYNAYRRYGYVIRVKSASDIPYVLFPVIALLSLILSPSLRRSDDLLGDFQILVQYLYWICLALFLRCHGFRIDWRASFKAIFWGLNLLIVCFYLVDFTFLFGPFLLMLGMPRNGFVFQMLCMVPFALYYVWISKKRIVFYGFCLFYTFLMLHSEGRAGSILLLLEIALLLFVLRPIPPLIKWSIALAFGIALSALCLIDHSTLQRNRMLVGSIFEQLNPRLANLITGKEDGDLSEDESWLIRKLMIEKAREINNSYPVLGIGLNRFTQYDARLQALNSGATFRDIRGKSDNFYNTKSAHNSYYQILAETGFAGLFLILLILGVPFVATVYSILFRQSKLNLLGISLVGIAIHFYVISSITGAIGWFVIGVAYFSISHEARVLLSYTSGNDGYRKGSCAVLPR